MKRRCAPLTHLSRNTTSFYMRILRATYNRAVDKGVIRQRFPFKHVYTGVEKTVKRAISFKSNQTTEGDGFKSLSVNGVCA